MIDLGPNPLKTHQTIRARTGEWTTDRMAGLYGAGARLQGANEVAVNDWEQNGMDLLRRMDRRLESIKEALHPNPAERSAQRPATKPAEPTTFTLVLTESERKTLAWILPKWADREHNVRKSPWSTPEDYLNVVTIGARLTVKR